MTHDAESPEVLLKDAPPTDMKNNNREEGSPEVLKFKNSLDEEEEHEIEEISDGKEEEHESEETGNDCAVENRGGEG
jgi:hypothetical protein